MRILLYFVPENQTQAYDVTQVNVFHFTLTRFHFKKGAAILADVLGSRKRNNLRSVINDATSETFHCVILFSFLFCFFLCADICYGRS